MAASSAYSYWVFAARRARCRTLKERKPSNFASTSLRLLDPARSTTRRCTSYPRSAQHNACSTGPVPDALLREAIDLAKMGPTAPTRRPMRVVFRKKRHAKERSSPPARAGERRQDDAGARDRDRRYDLGFLDHSA